MKKILAIFFIILIFFVPIKVKAVESSIEFKEQNVSYLVNFNSNGGNEIESQKVLENNNVIKPLDPIKEGYIFDGWYSDSLLKNKFDFNTLVNKNIELYAKWIESITITYDLNGGIATNNYQQMVIISKSDNKIIINDLIGNICNIPEGYAFFGIEVNGIKYNIKNTKYITLTKNSTIKFLWNKVINQVIINLSKPDIGSSTSVDNDNNNWNWEKANNVPNAYVSNDLPYKVVETYWIMGFSGQELDTPFIGTFEVGKKYYAQIYIEAHEGYQFNEYVSVLVNGENIDSLILLENNSPKYGTSYMCVGKEIVLNKTINNKTEVNKTNNDGLENKVNNNIENISNKEDESKKTNLTNIASNITSLRNNHEIMNNSLKSNNDLTIWYMITIVGIIGLSIIYLKNTY